MPSATSQNIDDFETLLVALQDVLGVVVPDEQRNQLAERIKPLLSTYRLDSMASLAKCLLGDKSDSRQSNILTEVLDVLSQRQVSWQLNPEITQLLHKYILAQLPDKAKIWVVGCGQGQVAYAVAMEILEFEQKGGDIKNVQIVATDISEKNIEYAESATYSELQLADLRDTYRKLYTSFNANENTGQIKDRVCQMVSFVRCDLKENCQSLGDMDLIICPDALVYYSNGLKASILQQFSDRLKAGGIFVTGNNQVLVSLDNGMERVEHPAGLFYRKKS